MGNIRLTIAYDGSAYAGWQRQPNRPTVQALIEDALTQRLLGEPVVLHGAGRTDAGVHAEGMVASFVSPRELPLEAYRRGLNSMLPPDIRILAADKVAHDFHARFSAKGKVYCYRFSTAAIMSPCRRLYRAHLPGPFDADLVREVIPQLLGEHDFSAFEAAGSRDRSREGGRGGVRSLEMLRLEQEDRWGREFFFELAGDGFLRHMVRNIVGTLVALGRGRRRIAAPAALLAGGDRSQAGPTAPACGLTLVRVLY
ncbi:tRNA pseudouridine(38-40) synthase TruA [Desulfurivibrio dismutans]|uniref:tRNA pseudouridine(38-40) synthase TruA n=1 Tax=Desulfurivibrio dismutans TaxID=1398908 RepID=UPI0023DC9077|nr:tRNA pseudouridine(38-40) synthase TruA [Desulfurivibrio alkaliphilus]MDF1614575.1 tRNA pseudouridine(38-40) synthase TruA [Desulfurivibrio alkaliphilus]